MGQTFKPPEKKALATEFAKVKPSYERLVEEIHFAIEKKICEQEIKIHVILPRIKDFDEFYAKIIRNEIIDDFFEEIEDVAGIRIICLYRSDLQKVGKVISEQLKVIKTDIKTQASRASEFGYMSDHYIVKLPASYKGARYDDIKPLKCEIQVRTISMDAWDSVSHHLDYKQKIDIPSELRRDFYALSGLFYLADTHFEMFRDSVKKLRSQLAESVKKDEFDLGQEINLETLRAYLKRKLPNRKKAEDIIYSELLSELLETNYSRFDKLDNALDRSMDAAEAREKDDPPSVTDPSTGKKVLGKLNVVGFVRECLLIFDANFLSVREKRTKIKGYWNENIEKYRALLKTR